MKHTRNSSPSRVAGARAAAQRRQSGVALIVALILLVVITVIGLAAIRTSTLQEKMAGNTFDRAQAFQVAEATLQLASATILPPAPPPDPATYQANAYTDCANNPCLDNPAHDPNVPAAAWTLPPTATNAGGGTANIVSLYGNNPSYIIQYMGACTVGGGGNFQFTNDENNQGGGGSLKTAGQCYRITARSSTPGNGAPPADRASVTLQAIFRTS
ncbi:MAG: pilus assembly protein [Betaproteobacteria bacterium]|jgi:type IV pilus assembly protein PilX|uniref:pilus assembly PilX family protein n=1 Tax=Thiomonas sp. TaxID=2047785 RepID=UPI00239F28C8|nr:PilX N-terminal domain-containing pilus assembly protein [Thiomonas sp.]MDE2176084.1 pilus assembly protein [Betaproteobacteria bacterium]